MKKPESRIQYECLVWLNKNGFYAWRNSSVGVYDKKRGRYRRPPPFAIPGVSDIIAIKDGVTLFIEVKTEDGKVSQVQMAFAAQCARHGVRYIVARSVEGMVEQL